VESEPGLNLDAHSKETYSSESYLWPSLSTSKDKCYVMQNGRKFNKERKGMAIILNGTPQQLSTKKT
jgi:hypothetical protein